MLGTGLEIEDRRDDSNVLILDSDEDLENSGSRELLMEEVAVVIMELVSETLELFVVRHRGLLVALKPGYFKLSTWFRTTWTAFCSTEVRSLLGLGGRTTLGRELGVEETAAASAYGAREVTGSALFEVDVETALFVVLLLLLLLLMLLLFPLVELLLCVAV